LSFIYSREARRKLEEALRKLGKSEEEIQEKVKEIDDEAKWKFWIALRKITKNRLLIALDKALAQKEGLK